MLPTKKYFFLALFILTFAYSVQSQARLNNLYKKFENSDNFHQFEISNKLFSWINIFSNKNEKKSIEEILGGIGSFKVTTLKNDKSPDFQYFTKRIDKQFAKKRYKIVLKDKAKEKGKGFYLRSNLHHIKELHYIARSDKKITLISIKGKVPLEHIESLGKMLKQSVNKVLD